MAFPLPPPFAPLATPSSPGKGRRGSSRTAVKQTEQQTPIARSKSARASAAAIPPQKETFGSKKDGAGKFLRNHKFSPRLDPHPKLAHIRPPSRGKETQDGLLLPLFRSRMKHNARRQPRLHPQPKYLRLKVLFRTRYIFFFFLLRRRCCCHRSRRGNRTFGG